ncbi:preprotein translocase subunit YajC [bacterium]|nr:preprotein translocase subunit YajC [bacterium]
MLLLPMLFQAAPATPSVGASIMSQLLFIVPMIAIFYFLLIRPQQRRAKAHRDMLSALKRGDSVVTTGGIIGKIAKLSDDEVTLDTGEGGKLRIVRSMIMDVRNRSEPAPANDVKES